MISLIFFEISSKSNCQTRGIPVLALYTDTRQQGGRHPEKINALNEIGENQFHYLNLYTVGLVKLNGAVVSTVEALKEALQKYLK